MNVGCLKKCLTKGKCSNMHKLSTERMFEVYKEAIKLNVCKDFIMLLSEELNKRYILETFQEEKRK